jgi:hypothetical protein
MQLNMCYDDGLKMFGFLLGFGGFVYGLLRGDCWMG